MTEQSSRYNQLDEVLNNVVDRLAYHEELDRKLHSANLVAQVVGATLSEPWADDSGSAAFVARLTQAEYKIREDLDSTEIDPVSFTLGSLTAVSQVLRSKEASEANRARRELRAKEEAAFNETVLEMFFANPDNITAEKLGELFIRNFDRNDPAYYGTDYEGMHKIHTALTLLFERGLIDAKELDRRRWGYLMQLHAERQPTS